MKNYRIVKKSDVEKFAFVYFSRKGTQEKLHSILNLFADRYKESSEEEQVGFKKTSFLLCSIISLSFSDCHF